MAVRRRRIESELEARRCLLRVEAEDAQVGAWARAHGIDGRSLNMWRVNLARREGVVPRPPARQPPMRLPATSVVEIVPTAMASTTTRYVIELDGVRLELGDDFAEPTVRRLIGVLRSC